jgi:hypothetical protein
MHLGFHGAGGNPRPDRPGQGSAQKTVRTMRIRIRVLVLIGLVLSLVVSTSLRGQVLQLVLGTVRLGGTARASGLPRRRIASACLVTEHAYRRVPDSTAAVVVPSWSSYRAGQRLQAWSHTIRVTSLPLRL